MLPAPYQAGQSMTIAEIQQAILLNSMTKDPDAPKDRAAGRSLVTTVSGVNILEATQAATLTTFKVVEGLLKQKGVTVDSPQVKALWTLNTRGCNMLMSIGDGLPALTAL